MRLAALLMAACCCAAAAESTVAERTRQVIAARANPVNPEAGGYDTIAARLYLKQDAAWCSQRLEKMLSVPLSGDMFWMFPVAAIAQLDRGQLTPSARVALRRAWKTYMPYRGDTENHWLLYYASLYLMSELYPDDGPETWFTGKSSKANMAEAREWIEHWTRLTTTRGQGEYDSPTYVAMFLIPTAYLHAWAKDPVVKKRAGMMLEYLIADYAPENLSGLHVGAASRVYDQQLLEKALNWAPDFGWLWFNIGRPNATDGYLFYYAIAGAYEPPDILREIATDRSKPYTHLERKRTRNRWRFNDDLHGPVYKKTYVRREYAVGSDQGGVLQPIQQHSWDVTWAVPDPHGVQNTFFFLNPHSSIHELQTYFVFTPDTGIQDVISSKKFYDSPDKFSGGSPWERIVQDQDTLVALYDIPDGERFPHINGFFSKDLKTLAESREGWIFMEAGDAYIACKPLQPYVWKPLEGGGKRLFSPYQKNGVVVQVAARSEHKSLGDFRRAVLALPFESRLEPTPGVRMTSLRGTRIEFDYSGTPSLNGRPVDYTGWPLFGGPFLESAVDSGSLVIRHGGKCRKLDFNKLEVANCGV